MTTLEKWDVIMHEQTDISHTNLQGLIIINDIRLLHDGRGSTMAWLYVFSFHLLFLNIN